MINKSTVKGTWLDAARVFVRHARVWPKLGMAGPERESLAKHRAWSEDLDRTMREEAGWPYEEWRRADGTPEERAEYGKMLEAELGKALPLCPLDQFAKDNGLVGIHSPGHGWGRGGPPPGAHVQACGELLIATREPWTPEQLVEFDRLTREGRTPAGAGPS